MICIETPKCKLIVMSCKWSTNGGVAETPTSSDFNSNSQWESAARESGHLCVFDMRWGRQHPHHLTMATDILESAPWSMVKMVILWSNFVVRSTVYHFDHRKFVFRSWPWSKLVFLVKFRG